MSYVFLVERLDTGHTLAYADHRAEPLDELQALAADDLLETNRPGVWATFPDGRTVVTRYTPEPVEAVAADAA